MSGMEDANAVRLEMRETRKALKAKRLSPWVFVIWDPPEWAMARPLGDMLKFLPRVSDGTVEQLEVTVQRTVVEFGRHFGQRVRPDALTVTGWRPSVVLSRSLGRHRVADLMWVLNELTPKMGVSQSSFGESLPKWVSNDDVHRISLHVSECDRMSPGRQLAHSTTLDRVGEPAGGQGGQQDSRST